MGYAGTPTIMKALAADAELKKNLSAVAHLIHGSAEGRFSITYAPGRLTREEVEGVGFRYAAWEELRARYDVATLQEGWNTEVNEAGAAEEFYYISNPALGLWAVASRFEEEEAGGTAASTTPSSSSCEKGPPATDLAKTMAKNQEASDMNDGVGGWKKPPLT